MASPLVPGQGMPRLTAVGKANTAATYPWVNTLLSAKSGSTVGDWLVAPNGPISTLLTPADVDEYPAAGMHMLGTNNCSSDANVIQGLADTATMYADALAARPDLLWWATFTIPPFDSNAFNTRANDFNAGLPAIVSASTANGLPTYLFDLNGALDRTTDIGLDGVHLNDSGQAKAGYFIYRALRYLCGLDGSPLPRILGRFNVSSGPGDSNWVGINGSPPGLYPGGLRQVKASYYWLNTPPIAPLLLPIAH